jgi:hypothetical protein
LLFFLFTFSKKNLTKKKKKKKAGGVAQGVGPEFKPQYRQKTNKQKDPNSKPLHFHEIGPNQNCLPHL